MSRWRLHFGPGTRRRQASLQSGTPDQPPHPPARVEVAAGVWLDSRLALYCTSGNWLAIADIHYGYELSQQSAGFLFPDYGSAGIEARLDTLLTDYQPQTLILVGDMVHDHNGVAGFMLWLKMLRERVPEIIMIRGNHDRHLLAQVQRLDDYHATNPYFFHHGDRDQWRGKGEIEITGHWHPATTATDGAGTSVRAPAFLREPRESGGERWVMPAFSPWTGGTIYPRKEGGQLWLCHPRRILPV